MVVGITGGIGSGKSTVTKIFAALGVPVYYSDIRARILYDLDPEVKRAMIRNFGDDIYTHGIINKEKLSKLVFYDKKQREIVNSIIHPAVARDFEEWKRRQNSDYMLKEAAILFESGAFRKVDKIITVIAPRKRKIRFLQSRENISEEEIVKRMNAQWTDEKRIPLSDFVITNDNQHLLIPQVLSVHENLLANLK